MLSTRLRTTRTAKGLSQVQLGSLAGCGQEKISSYEIGKLQPRYGTLIRLADALQVSIDYLLGRSDEIEKKTVLEDVLSDDEIDLILRYRELSKEKQAKLTGIAIGLGQ